MAAALGLLVLSAGRANAASPVGCEQNNANLNGGVTPFAVNNGGTATYTVTFDNSDSALSCDVHVDTITFTCPGATGTANGPETDLVGGTSSVAPFECGGGANFVPGHCYDSNDHFPPPGLQCTINVNSGVTFARANAAYTGILRHNDEPASGDKNFDVTVNTPTPTPTDTPTPTPTDTPTPTPTNTPTATPTPAEETCRTPGYWKTHPTVTSAVIEEAGGCMVVCGEQIDAVGPAGNANSAIEGLSVTGGGTRRLASHLIAAALNCVVSGDSSSDPRCSNTSIADTYAACDTACAKGQTTATIDSQTIDCIDAIDAFNNGETCHDQPVGLCKGTTTLCDASLPCEGDVKCKSPDADSGPSQLAKDSSCTVVPSGENQCNQGNKCSPTAAGFTESCANSSCTAIP